ncbi:hypothetical protein PCIT_a0822 [Pseudoalteromonas citrea]|uniref:DUF3192 domain-containing protein n=2 Tax=Pseudoalteromonas citrea TaxID=43655 RepID=A0AAD4FT96_9GAMM|nr:DUF3192 domain-containing protein [Pseudoalteromonas citrea]KAF7774386.1 hypothetical protein PCIT_a0822 [Pseudoalteromonas citrea]
MKKLLIAALLATPFLSGCIVAVSDGEAEYGWNSKHNGKNWQEHQKSNREKIANLPNGAEYKSVIKQFDTPDFSELVNKGGTVFQILYFSTNSKHSDGKITKDECTPLVFKAGKLIGIGQSAVIEYL